MVNIFLKPLFYTMVKGVRVDNPQKKRYTTVATMQSGRNDVTICHGPKHTTSLNTISTPELDRFPVETVVMVLTQLQLIEL